MPIASASALGVDLCLPPLQWCQLKDTTFIGALEAATSATDQPYDYATLMALSGLAFRVRWHQPADRRSWKPWSAMGDDRDTLQTVRKTTGWQLKVAREPDPINGAAERFLPQIIATVDHGTPVLCYRRLGHLWDTALVCGYEQHGSVLLISDYFAGSEPIPHTPDQLYPFFVFLDSCVTPPEPAKALTLALQTAIGDWYRESPTANRSWHWPRYPGKDTHAYGDTALGAWMADLARAGELDPEAYAALFHASWFHFDALYSARTSAAHFLNHSAAQFEGAGRIWLEQAAKTYAEEQTLLEQVWNNGDAFCGPWTKHHAIDDWSNAVREREIDILATIRALDNRAIRQLTEALEVQDQLLALEAR